MPSIAESSHWSASCGSWQARAYLRISLALSRPMETKGGLSTVRGGTSMVNIRGAGGAATDMWCRTALYSARMVSGANSLLAGSFGWPPVMKLEKREIIKMDLV